MQTGARGGGLFKFQAPTPPSPSRPPNFANPSFSNLRFWGKVSVPKAPKIFLCLPQGVFCFNPMRLYSKYSKLRGEFKYG